MYILRLSQYCRPIVTHARANITHSCRAFHATFLLRFTDMETVHTTERLAHLRALMKKHEVDIYSIFPTKLGEQRGLTVMQSYLQRIVTNPSI